MNHKRGKPKKARSGCLMCKPHKHNGAKGSFINQTRQEQKAIIDEQDQQTDFVHSCDSSPTVDGGQEE